MIFVQTNFKHSSEESFAKLIESIEIDWLYRPVNFVLATDKEGLPVDGFSPDFYLPTLDLYIQISTFRFRNRAGQKIKRLKKVYPHINIKTFGPRELKKAEMGKNNFLQLLNIGI